MNQQWDVIVIGAGPAGLTAAGTVAGKGLSCACIDRLGPGGMLMNLGHIRDCHEAPPEATGPDLVAGLVDEALEAGVEMLFGEVRELVRQEIWLLKVDEEEHRAKAVVIATGLSSGKLGIANEENFAGRGLSHCASCDGPLFAGQEVVVTGNDRWTHQEALELSGTAGHVTVIGDIGAGDIGDSARTLISAGNITTVSGRITGLKGSDGLEAVVITHDGSEREMAAHGVFAYVDRQPELEFAGGSLDLDPAGRILVDDTLLACVPFLFAVGDVRAGSAESISGAISDGRRAGLTVTRLLDQESAPRSGERQPG